MRVSERKGKFINLRCVGAVKVIEKGQLSAEFQGLEN
jgi:hypothetical protein